MKTITNCYKQDNPLIQKRLKEVSVEEGLTIATELFSILNKRKDGIGLAANQVGIDARVAVLNVREPLILINPEIISKEVEIPFYEGCLSYPGKGCHTKRYRDIVVSTAQEESNWYFSGALKSTDKTKGTWEESIIDSDQEAQLRVLESVCVQHEIDHLNGMRILDRVVNTTIRTERKIGRNNLVTIKKGDAVKVLKYKKAQKFLSEGWEISA